MRHTDTSYADTAQPKPPAIVLWKLHVVKGVIDVQLPGEERSSPVYVQAAKGVDCCQRHASRVPPVGIAPATINNHLPLHSASLADEENVGTLGGRLKTEFHYSSLRQPVQPILAHSWPSQRRVFISSPRHRLQSLLHLGIKQQRVMEEILHLNVPTVSP